MPHMRREKGGETHVRLLHAKRIIIQFIDELMRIEQVYLRHLEGHGSMA